MGHTVIKSPQKLSVIQQSPPTYSSLKYKMGITKSEAVENEENSIIKKFKENPSDESIPSTSGSGMQINSNIPSFILHTQPDIRMTAMKFQTITITRL